MSAASPNNASMIESGLRSLDGESIYIGCASGRYLDESVNQERDGFTFSSSEETLIRRGVASSVREYLKDYISVSRRGDGPNTQALVRENPQFLFIKQRRFRTHSSRHCR